MAKKLYHDIDLVQNQIINARIHNVTTLERTAIGLTLDTNDKGFCVFDINLLKVYYWDGTVWITGTVGTVTSVDLTAGTGISVGGGPITTNGSITVTNTAPDQVVVLNSGAGINVTGSYPNFTIANTYTGDYITQLTGEATAVGPGSAAVTLTNSAVIGKVLTGLNVVGSTIVATDTILQAFGKVQNQINSLVGGLNYQGVWDASTNTPTLTSSVGTKGYYYKVSVAGTTSIDGTSDWEIGDLILFNGTVWDQIDNTDSVSSVNGYTGPVSLVTGDVLEGAGVLPGRPSNLYYTDARARAAVSLTTSGTSGAATYNSSTGVFNIPQYPSLASFSATSPIFYNSTTGVISSQAASATLEGYVTTGTQSFSGNKTIINDTDTGNTLLTLRNNVNGNEALSRFKIESNGSNCLEFTVNSSLWDGGAYGGQSWITGVGGILNISAGANVVLLSKPAVRAGSGNYSEFVSLATTTRTATLQDASGTIAFTSDIPDGTDFIQNQTASTQTADFKISGVGIFGAGSSSATSIRGTNQSANTGIYFSGSTGIAFAFSGVNILASHLAGIDVTGIITATSKANIGSPSATAGAVNVGQDGIYSYRSAGRYMRFNTSGTFNDFLSLGAKLVMNYGFSGTVENISMFEGSSAGDGQFIVGSPTATNARFLLKGKDTGSTNYISRWFDSGNTEKFSVRNDGQTTIASLSAGGIVKSTSGVLAIATAGTDYLTPTGSGSGLSGVVLTTTNQSIAGIKTFTDSIASSYTGNIFLSASSGLSSHYYAQIINTNGNIQWGVASSISPFFTSGTNGAAALGTSATTALEFGTSNITRYSISSGGNHDFKTGTATFGGALTGTTATFTGDVYAEKIYVENGGGGSNMTLTAAGSVNRLAIAYSGWTDVDILTNNSIRYSIDSSGNHDFKSGTATFSNQIINTFTGGTFLDVTTATTSGKTILIGNTGADCILGVGSSSSNTILGGSAAYSTSFGTRNATSLHFGTNGTVGYTMDSSRNNTWTGTGSFANTITSGNGAVNAILSYSSIQGIVGTSTNHPLSVQINNAERGRFTSGGFFKASNDGTYWNSTGPNHELRSNSNDFTLLASNTHASNPNGYRISYTGATPNDTASYFIYAEDSSAVRFMVTSNGGVHNFSANNVNLSDENAKKDIVSMGSQWEIFKNIDFVKYKYKDQTHDDYNYGVIAQQVLKVAPHFVNTDGFGDTNMLSVYDSDIHYSAHKALQEALIRIEESEKEIVNLKKEISLLKS